MTLDCIIFEPTQPGDEVTYSHEPFQMNPRCHIIILHILLCRLLMYYSPQRITTPNSGMIDPFMLLVPSTHYRSYPPRKGKVNDSDNKILISKRINQSRLLGS